MQKIKIRKHTSIFGVVLALGVCFTSCLKTSSIPPLSSTNGSNNVVMFQDNGGPDGSSIGPVNPFPSYNFSFSQFVNDTAGFYVNVMYGPLGTAPQDITVHLAVDTIALNTFDSVNNLSYVCPDTTIYSFPSTVIIPKGQSMATIRVTIKASNSYDYGASYALPLSIASSSYGTISSNFGSEVNSFLLKNSYDGDYAITDTISGGATTVTTETVHLVTSGLTSIKRGDLGGYFSGSTNYIINSDGTIGIAANSGGDVGAKVVSSSYDASSGNFAVTFTILGGAYKFVETAVKQ